MSSRSPREVFIFRNKSPPLPILFDKKLFIILVAAFIAATIIGTLSHELGHYTVAKSLGYRARLHYASVHWYDPASSDSINAFVSRYWKQIEEGSSFPGKEKYDLLARKYSNDGLWSTIGGPFQTMLTGTIGILLLFAWRKSFQSKQRLAPRQWTLTFITLFWLRQTANLIVWLGTYLVKKHFSYTGDEVQLAVQLGLPFWLLTTITGIIGLVILTIVIFQFIPKQQRLTFILAGTAGGVAGYIVWLYLVGPVLLP